jgi:hypothetical protein
MDVQPMHQPVIAKVHAPLYRSAGCQLLRRATSPLRRDTAGVQASPAAKADCSVTHRWWPLPATSVASERWRWCIDR